MSLMDIKQKANGKLILLKTKKWTKKKTIGVVLIVLMLVFLIVFFIGNQDGVDYIKVSEQDYVEKIVAVGQLGMENQTSIVSQVSGTIEMIGAEAGETVSAGSVILSIKNSDQSSDIEQKKSNYLDVQEQYNSLVEMDYVVANEDLERLALLMNQAKKSYLDAQTLYQEGAISQSNLNDYMNAYESIQNQWSATSLRVESMGLGGSKRNSLYYKLETVKSIYDNSLEEQSKYRIRMGWDALILGTYFNVNDTVKPGDVLADVGQAGTYSAVTDLDEKYFMYIKKGMKADISAPGQELVKPFKGEISVITPKINKNTGTFQVEIKLLSPVEVPASDLTVNIEIPLTERPKAIVLPKQYLINDASFVFIYKGGIALKTEVQIERGPSSNVIVIKGLEPGDTVLLPAEGMKDGDRVKLKKGVDPA